MPPDESRGRLETRLQRRSTSLAWTACRYPCRAGARVAAFGGTAGRRGFAGKAFIGLAGAGDGLGAVVRQSLRHPAHRRRGSEFSGSCGRRSHGRRRHFGTSRPQTHRSSRIRRAPRPSRSVRAPRAHPRGAPLRGPRERPRWLGGARRLPGRAAGGPSGRERPRASAARTGPGRAPRPPGPGRRCLQVHAAAELVGAERGGECSAGGDFVGHVEGRSALGGVARTSPGGRIAQGRIGRCDGRLVLAAGHIGSPGRGLTQRGRGCRVGGGLRRGAGLGSGTEPDLPPGFRAGISPPATRALGNSCARHRPPVGAI